MARVRNGCVVFWCLALLLGGCVERRDLAPHETPGDAARNQLEAGPAQLEARVRQHTIWPELTSRPPIHSYVMLHEGAMVMRRFQSPVRGYLLRGAFYTIASDQLKRDVTVSVCADTNGQPDDGTRLGSTRVTARVPLVAARTPHPPEYAYPAEFTVECHLQPESYYWLVLEPTWVEDWPTYMRHVYPYAFKRYLTVLITDQPSGDTISRYVGPDCRPPSDELLNEFGLDRWPPDRCVADLVAELRLAGSTKDALTEE